MQKIIEGEGRRAKKGGKTKSKNQTKSLIDLLSFIGQYPEALLRGSSFYFIIADNVFQTGNIDNLNFPFFSKD